jgi:hypothetical protein
MYFFPSRLVVLLALAAMAVTAPAQQTIIFSKPADLSVDRANSFLSGPAHRASDFNAPRDLFDDSMPDLPAPRLQPNNNNAALRDTLNRRKNWTLLTPEQILGIQTPEQILGLPDKTHDNKLSLEEQFLLREAQASSGTHTNSQPGGSAWRAVDEVNPFAARDQPSEDNSFRQARQKTTPGTKFFNGFLNAPGSSAGPGENPGTAWNTSFFQPTRPKPTAEQQAEMERFRALMAPSPPPDPPPVPTRFSVAPAPDPFLQAVPVVNPAGRGISPLENLFSRPTGIQPLPGISTAPPAPATVRPSWQAQLPPWLKNGPQTHNPSQSF